MIPFASTLGPSAYWYLTRGTGAVSLVLLTISVVIGIGGTLRLSAERWPRFAVDTVHRDVSLLVIVVLVVHIITSVLDSFAPISITAAVIPFISAYRPLWLGFGTLAFDLLLALAITSLVRRRLGYRTWRAVHWLAYLSWPIAVLHGLGTGSDTKIWWMLGLTALCVAAVTVAICLRIAREPALAWLRAPGLALSVAAPVAIAVFAIAGPLSKGWARRAGTPARLLAHAAPTTPATSSSGASSSTSSGASPSYTPRAFTALLSGSVRQSQIQAGAIVDIDMRMHGGARGQLRVRLAGAGIPGGGLSLTGSQVDLIANGIPTVMQGQVSSLQGDDFDARVLGGSGASLTLHVRLHIDQVSNAVSGLVNASPGQ